MGASNKVEYIPFPDDGTVDYVFLVNASIEALWKGGWFKAKIDSTKRRGKKDYFEIVWDEEGQRTELQLTGSTPDTEWRIASASLTEAKRLSLEYSRKKNRHPLQMRRDDQEEALLAQVIDPKDNDFVPSNQRIAVPVAEIHNLRPHPKVI